MDPEPPRKIWLVLLRVVVVVGLGAALWLWLGRSQIGAVDYSTAYEWVRDGKVQSVELAGGAMDGELVSAQTVDGRSMLSFHTSIPATDEALLPMLREHHVRIKVADSTVGAKLAAILPWLALIGVWIWLSRRRQGSPFGSPFAGFTRRARKFEKSTQVATRFDDIAGSTSAKRDLQEIVMFLKDPGRIDKLGARLPRGVLLVGPPGTGKTLIARAVAGEADVPFFSITGSEFIEMFVGVGAARVRELFEDAKKAAPSIVFIDELDAVGRVRGAGLGTGHDEREQTLDQLLAEMDGFDRHDEVVVIAATNRPDVLDPALLRPGRFDRRVVLDLPEVGARRDILVVHTRGKPLAPDVDLQELAAMTPGFSGADLANLVNEAALHAMRMSNEHVDRADLLAAYDKIVLGDPREGKLAPNEKQRIAVHEAGHTVVAWALADADPPRRVSILPRGLTLGATEQIAAEDRHVLTRAALDAKLAVLLGGYAAEAAVLREPSTGAERDLREATALAEDMVAHYGMSEALGPVYYEHHEQHAFLGHRIATEAGPSDATIHVIEDQARLLLGQARERATATLARNRGLLDKLVASLLEHETLEEAELAAVLGTRAPELRAVGAG